MNYIQHINNNIFHCCVLNNEFNLILKNNFTLSTLLCKLPFNCGNLSIRYNEINNIVINVNNIDILILEQKYNEIILDFCSNIITHIIKYYENYYIENNYSENNSKIEKINEDMQIMQIDNFILNESIDIEKCVSCIDINNYIDDINFNNIIKNFIKFIKNLCNDIKTSNEITWHYPLENNNHYCLNSVTGKKILNWITKYGYKCRGPICKCNNLNDHILIMELSLW